MNKIIKIYKRKNKIENQRKEKGITVITITVAVCIILIISSMLIFNARTGLRMRNYQYMQNDIEVLDSKINSYYVKYGALPITYVYTNIQFEQQPNDSGEYYVIDLSALDGISLNYGEEYIEIDETTTDAEMEEKNDVYIIDKQSHHIYYARGIELDGEIYYTNTTDEEVNIIDI